MVIIVMSGPCGASVVTRLGLSSGVGRRVRNLINKLAAGLAATASPPSGGK